MADTQLSMAAALAGLANNTSGDISPQDVRNLGVTLHAGVGQIYVPASAAASVTIAGTVNYVEVTEPVWSLSSGAYLFDESDGNGRLTYTGEGPVTAIVTCSISFRGNAGHIIHLRIGKNAATLESAEAIRKLGNTGDVGSTGLSTTLSLVTGDYISLWVRNESSATNVTMDALNLQAVTSPS